MFGPLCACASLYKQLLLGAVWSPPRVALCGYSPLLAPLSSFALSPLDALSAFRFPSPPLLPPHHSLFRHRSLRPAAGFSKPPQNAHCCVRSVLCLWGWARRLWRRRRRRGAHVLPRAAFFGRPPFFLPHFSTQSVFVSPALLLMNLNPLNNPCASPWRCACWQWGCAAAPHPGGVRAAVGKPAGGQPTGDRFARACARQTAAPLLANPPLPRAPAPSPLLPHRLACASPCKSQPRELK